MTVEQQEPPAKRMRLDYSDAIRLNVGKGKNQASFSVPKHVLCAKSEYFKTACSGDWLEAQDKKVHLAAESPALFQVYRHWAYTGAIDLGLLQAAVAPRNGCHGLPTQHHLAFIDLYCLADYLQAVDLTKNILETFFDYLRNPEKPIPGAFTVGRAYPKTTTGSPLRRLLVQCYVGRRERGQTLHARLSLYDEDFVLDVAVALLSTMPTVSMDVLQSRLFSTKGT